MLKLNGKPLVLHRPTPSQEKILAFLSKSPDNELFTTDEMARKLGLNAGCLRDMGAKELFSAQTLKVGSARYWGNPKAIAALRQQVQP